MAFSDYRELDRLDEAWCEELMEEEREEGEEEEKMEEKV